jgi:predicted RNA-binding Zn-ribbon protein involved in translation (DUF1610 family)
VANVKFKCPECSKEFNDPRGLGKHRSVAHSVPGMSHSAVARRKQLGVDVPGKFPCPDCSRTFGSKVGLRTHRAMAHRSSGVSSPKLGRPKGTRTYKKKILIQDDWWLVQGAILALKEQGFSSSIVLSALRTVHTIGVNR